MAVLQMLSEMICTEELLALVAFAKFVYGREVVATSYPILSREVGKLITTVSTHIVVRGNTRLLWWSMIGIGVWRNSVAWVEGGLIVTV